MLPLILLAAWKKQMTPATARKIKGTLRVMGWVTCTSIAAGAFLTHSAAAHAQHTSLSFGRELSAIAPTPEGITHLKLNGQSIYYAQEWGHDSVHDVLGRFTEACEKNPAAFGEAYAKLPKDMKWTNPMGETIPGPPAEMSSGVLKQETDDEGTLICFTQSSKSGGTFREAYERFERTQDLGEIGRMRYVYVKKGQEKTQTITAWTEDSFRFDKIGLAASSEEAPGTDTALPRPDHARRVLNVEVVGTQYGVRVYEVPQTTEQVASFYDNWAHDAGFTGIAPDMGNGTKIRAYFREGTQVMVGSFEVDGKRYFSVSEITPKNGHAVQVANPQ